MPEAKGKQLDFDDRCEIEEMLGDGSSFRAIARKLGETQAHVKAALDAVEAYCEGAFPTALPVILTDRGSEFLDYSKIETGIDGGRRCRVLYCDPVKPGQKGSAEKNQVELRKILPKGTDFDALTFWDVAEASSHVNSYVRAGQGAAPIRLAQAVLPGSLLENLGVRAVETDDVVMRPGLLGLQQGRF